MYIERREIKLAAKDSLRWAAPHPMLATLVYFVIVIGISMVVGFFTGMSEGDDMGLSWAGYHPGLFFGAMHSGVARTLVIFFYILLYLFSSIMSYGYYAAYSLGVSRKQFSNIRSFFAGFEQPVRIILVYILMSIFVVLWTLLFIVPGIVAAYRYRLALYLIADNPDISAMDAIRQSKKLMRGYKGQAFVLDLSFIGWGLLAMLTFGILGLWLTPYVAVTNANFYQAIQRSANG